MKLQLLYSLTIFWLAIVASEAALSPEVYWKIKLPNTQIPKVIKDFLPHAEDEVREQKQDNTEKKVYDNLHQLPYGAWIYHDATEDEIRELKGERPNMHRATAKNELQQQVTHESSAKSQLPFGAWIYHDATEDEIRELKGESPNTHRATTKIELQHVTKGSSSKSQLPYGAWIYHDATEDEIRELKGKSPNVHRAKTQLPYGAWIYHDATKDEIRKLKGESPNVHRATTKNEIKQQVTHDGSSAKKELKENFLYKPFFFPEDLEKGKVINFPSLKEQNGAPFFPRQFVESIPFSSKKVPEILNYFSIHSSSKNAQVIKETIKRCEDAAMRGEKKKCVTSLESMVDFTLSALGTNNIQAITTEVQGENQMLQKYTIDKVEEIAEGVNIICHKLKYAYAVHFCHGGGIIKTFMVSMVGADGTKVKAVSVCHKDTSLWNPKGLPFVVLQVKPGTTPICHFLKDDQIAFLPSKETTKLSEN